MVVQFLISAVPACHRGSPGVVVVVVKISEGFLEGP